MNDLAKLIQSMVNGGNGLAAIAVSDFAELSIKRRALILTIVHELFPKIKQATKLTASISDARHFVFNPSLYCLSIPNFPAALARMAEIAEIEGESVTFVTGEELYMACVDVLGSTEKRNKETDEANAAEVAACERADKLILFADLPTEDGGARVTATLCLRCVDKYLKGEIPDDALLEDAMVRRVLLANLLQLTAQPLPDGVTVRHTPQHMTGEKQTQSAMN